MELSANGMNTQITLNEDGTANLKDFPLGIVDEFSDRPDCTRNLEWVSGTGTWWMKSDGEIFIEGADGLRTTIVGYPERFDSYSWYHPSQKRCASDEVKFDVTSESRFSQERNDR